MTQYARYKLIKTPMSISVMLFGYKQRSQSVNKVIKKICLNLADSLYCMQKYSQKSGHSFSFK